MSQKIFLQIIQADVLSDSWSSGSDSDAEETEEIPVPVEAPEPGFTGIEILVIGGLKNLSALENSSLSKGPDEGYYLGVF